MNIFKSILNGLQGAGSALAAIPGMPNWAQAVAGGLGSMFGGIMQENSANTMYAQQKELLQNQQNFQREMFNRALDENHNSIINQYRQYRQLGINPLSLNGGMNQSNVSAPSAPSAPAASYTSPMELAQIRLANAQTTKTLAEANAIDPQESRSRTAYNDSLRLTNDALRTGQVDLQDVQINLGKENISLTKRQRDVLAEQINEIREHAANLAADTKSIMESTKFIDKQNLADLALKDAQINDLTVKQKQGWRSLALQYSTMLQQIKESDERIKQMSQQTQHEKWLTLSDKLKYNFENRTYYQRLNAYGKDLELQVAADENGIWRYTFDTYMFQHNTSEATQWWLRNTFSPLESVVRQGKNLVSPKF